MDLIEPGSVLADFFDQGMNSPSHDEIGKAFARQGLTDGDPKPSTLRLRTHEDLQATRRHRR